MTGLKSRRVKSGMEMAKQSIVYVDCTDMEILYQEPQNGDVWMYSNYCCGLNLLH